MIPKIFHYIWVGGKPLSEAAEENIRTWKASNPEFSVKRWDESNIDFDAPFIRRTYRLGYWARISDYVRLDVLRRFGGVYLDVDVKVIRSFSSMLNHKCFVGLTPDGDICNAVIGAEPGHWLMEEALSEIRRNMTGLEKINPSAGPEVITKILRNAAGHLVSSSGYYFRNVYVAPSEYFYPYGWRELFTEECITASTISIHLWGSSWFPSEKRKSLTRRLQDIMHAYPSLFRHPTTARVMEVAIFASECLGGRYAFLSRKMPWNA